MPVWVRHFAVPLAQFVGGHNTAIAEAFGMTPCHNMDRRLGMRSRKLPRCTYLGILCVSVKDLVAFGKDFYREQMDAMRARFALGIPAPDDSEELLEPDPRTS